VNPRTQGFNWNRLNFTLTSGASMKNVYIDCSITQNHIDVIVNLFVQGPAEKGP